MGADPKFFGELPNPVQIKNKVKKIMSNNTALQSQKKMFIESHSLGGVVARKTAKNLDVGGLILLGSYLPKSDIAGKDYIKDFPIPVFTIGGELDGLTGINY